MVLFFKCIIVLACVNTEILHICKPSKIFQMYDESGRIKKKFLARLKSKIHILFSGRFSSALWCKNFFFQILAVQASHTFSKFAVLVCIRPLTKAKSKCSHHEMFMLIKRGLGIHIILVELSHMNKLVRCVWIFVI